MTRLRIMVPICKGPIQEAIIHLFTTFHRGDSRVITREEMRIETLAGEDLQMSRHKAEGLMNNMVRESFAFLLYKLCFLAWPASKLSYLSKRSEPRENARARDRGKEARRSLARSRETRFTRPNRRAFSQAILGIAVADSCSCYFLKL